MCKNTSKHSGSNVAGVYRPAVEPPSRAEADLSDQRFSPLSEFIAVLRKAVILSPYVIVFYLLTETIRVIASNEAIALVDGLLNYLASLTADKMGAYALALSCLIWALSERKFRNTMPRERWPGICSRCKPARHGMQQTSAKADADLNNSAP